MRVYLDWNATTPPLRAVLDATREAAERAWANPASVHGHGRAARAVVEDARAAIATLGGVDARDVVLTSGGTEANNLALRSAFDDCDVRGGAVLVTSRLEHPSITRVAEALESEGRARVRWLTVTPAGAIDLADLARVLGEGGVRLVTVQAVNHETGIVQPVREAAEMARAAGARVHVDAVQAWGRVALGGEPLFGGDTASLAGHKMRGPKAMGALLTRPLARLRPVLLGGAQEKGLRPGTVDPTLAAGLAVAATRALESPSVWARVRRLRDELEAALLALDTGDGPPRVAGDPRARAPHVSNLVWPRWSGAELVAALDLEGVSVSSGAACSAGTVEPSPVLRAMLGDDDAVRGVRVSLGEDTTEDDVRFAAEAFARVVDRARR